jgi:hypothetical protein
VEESSYRGDEKVGWVQKIFQDKTGGLIVSKAIIEIHDFCCEPERKLEKATEVLSSIFGHTLSFEPPSWRKEISPYRSERELEEKVKESVEKGLLALFKEISYKWLGLQKAISELRLDGKIRINPKTGKPLTTAEWEKIKESVSRALSRIYRNEEERLAKTAMFLGKILNSLPTKEAIGRRFGDLKITPKKAMEMSSNLYYRETLKFAEQHTAEAIVDLTERSRKRIMDTILEAIKERVRPQELESRLFDVFGEMNRDWRRIAETEIGNNVNNGFIISEMEQEEDPEADIFMIGIASPNACPWCRAKIDNQVVILLEGPPEEGGDQVTVEGKVYTAIWPGKSNVGRKRTNWWIASGTQHPHCRCCWTRYEPEAEKYYKMLRDAMDKAAEAGKKVP